MTPEANLEQVIDSSAVIGETPPQAQMQAAVSVEAQPDAPETQQAAPPPSETTTPDAPTERSELEPLPAPEAELAPLFQLTALPREQAQPQAAELIRNFAFNDPVTYNLIASAVLTVSNQQTIQNYALKSMGVPREDVARFVEWRAKGGGELPEPVTMPKFEDTVRRLGSADGLQDDEQNKWVRLPNGDEINLADNRDKSYYESERRLYESELREKTEERARLETERQAAAEAEAQQAQQAQQDFTARVDYYESGRYAVANSLLDKTIANLSPDDQFRGVMLRAVVHQFLEGKASFTDNKTLEAANQQIGQLGRQAVQYLQEGYGFKKGTDGQWSMEGRAKQIADAQDHVITRAVRILIDEFNRDLVRTNRAELAATATSPQIPATAKTATVAEPNRTPPQSFEEIMERAQREDAARRTQSAH